MLNHGWGPAPSSTFAYTVPDKEKSGSQSEENPKNNEGNEENEIQIEDKKSQVQEERIELDPVYLQKKNRQFIVACSFLNQKNPKCWFKNAFKQTSAIKEGVKVSEKVAEFSNFISLPLSPNFESENQSLVKAAAKAYPIQYSLS